MDIDYMRDKQAFTLDVTRYNPKDFKATLEQYNKKFVMIIEPEIGLKEPNSKPYVNAIKSDVFIKNSYGADLKNTVWPGICFFFDYFNPRMPSYWNEQLSDLHETVPFSGIWLDMNEIATFADGQVNDYGSHMSCHDQEYMYLPGSTKPEARTVCGNAVHYGNVPHMAYHNFYSNQQAKLTNEFLRGKFKNEFPFILTRANAPGMGAYSSHWSGDNKGWPSFLKFSISETLNSNLFGIPHTGADICGFGEETPNDLCARWYQVGSLYPFSRSHNHLDYKPKEPFNRDATVLETTRKSLFFRYSILKHYYSEFIKLNGQGAIFKPLFF